VIVKAWPFNGGLGLVLMLLITGAEAGADTFKETDTDVKPVALLLTDTAKAPLARMACPDTCELVPLALMEQGESHPGPVKNMVELEGSKLAPLRVIVKAWPPTGGLGFVVTLLITGAVAGAETFNETVPEERPVALFRTETANVPAARIAWPEI
jgi:hypothetical protein